MSEAPIIESQRKGLMLSELIQWLQGQFQEEGDMPVYDFDAGGQFSNASIGNNFWIMHDARVGKVTIKKGMVVTA